MGANAQATVPLAGEDSVTVWNGCDGLLLLHAAYRTMRFPRHTHSTFVVGINEHSAHSFYCRRSRHSVPPGTIALVNPEEVHTGESVGPGAWRYRGFYPEPSWIQRLWEELTPHSPGIPMFGQSAVRDEELAEALMRFHRMSETRSSPLAWESAAVDTFSRLLLRHADRAPSRIPWGQDKLRVRRMREYMHAHLDQTVSLSMLAEVAGLGRFGVLRVFRRELGITPYEYLTSLRVERARVLLLGGERISSVAQSVGFSDQSHLTRRFKRHFGITPGTFVRTIKPRVNIVQDA